MKKARVFAFIATLIVIIAFGVYWDVENKLPGTDVAQAEAPFPQAIPSFELDNYMNHIDQFSSDKTVGAIDSPEMAIEQAVLLWTETFGDTIKTKAPFYVALDNTNGVWLVFGSLPPGYLGGVPYALIQKADGKVLAIWHTK